MRKNSFAIWFLSWCHFNVSLSRFLITTLPTVAPGPRSLAQPNGNDTLLQPRAVVNGLVTCMYVQDDPDEGRTTDTGYECRIDSQNGLWGFCPATVTAATDCGLAGSCEDEFDCSNGCGRTDEDLSTTTCSGSTDEYCSTILLTYRVGQTYSYIACGTKAVTRHYMVPTSTDTVATSSFESSASTIPTIALTSSTATFISGSTSDSKQGSTGLGENARPTSSESVGNASSASKSASPNTSVIIGGVIGALVLICVTIIAVIYLLRRKSTQSPRTQSQKDHASSPRFSLWRISNNPKEPPELAGWGPRELAGSQPPKLPNNNDQGCEHIAELN